MKTRFTSLFPRTAIMLLVMLLTSVSAWAFKTETPVTYSMTCSGSTIYIRQGATPTDSWYASNYWVANDGHSLGNGMNIKPDHDVSCNNILQTKLNTPTTFTFTTSGDALITSVTFKSGNNNVTATSTSSENDGKTFKVTLAGNTGFSGFEVTFGYISGSCGSNATWSLAKQNGKYTALTIGGSGAMSNYSGSNAPWDNDLTSVTIGSSITAIGNNAFNGCSNLTRVDIQKTDGLVTLSSSAFTGCGNLAAIVVPTPALALQYQSADGWSSYATKLRVALGNYLFTATNEGGTAAYAITSADDLRNLAAAVNAQKDISSGKTFRQTGDITLSGDFTPIANFDGDYFQGTYDGGNHTISGLSVNGSETYAGLFGYVYQGTVKNVRLVSPSVSSSQNYAYIGTIVGSIHGAHVENCWVYNPTVSATGSGSEVGAIIGKSAVDSDVLTNLYFYDNDGSHSYVAVGRNYSNHVTRVGRARKVTIGSGISSVSPAATDMANGFQYQGNNYYRESLELTLSATDELAAAAANQPTGYALTMMANGSATSSNTAYTVSATDGDVTLTAAVRSDGQQHQVSYVDASDESHNAQAIPLDGYETTIPAGTYFVGLPEVNFDHGITLTGDVTLILADGCTMNITTTGTGYCIYTKHTLDIYGQALGTGTLSAVTQGEASSVIFVDNGTLGIHSGTVNSTVGDTETGAPALYMKRATAGDVFFIDGGTINATSNNGCGIEIRSGIAHINGGHVTATGVNHGISVASYFADDVLTLGGGTVTTSSFYTYSSFSTIAGNIKIADGMTYTDGTATYNSSTASATFEALTNVTLQPCLTAVQADGNYWTTFYCGDAGYKIDDTENAYAYTATVANSTVTLHKLGKVIPKNTAVIIVGADNSISMTVSTAAAENTVENQLHGVDVRTATSAIKATLGDGTFYVLGNTNSHFGFHKYTGANMPANKAFLLLNGGSALSRSLDINWNDGDATGISAIETEREAAQSQYYDLQGRKVAHPTKGLYILRGKKVIIK